MLENKKLGDLLDVGGGPGVYFPLFKNRIKSYYLVDISSKMIENAEKHDFTNVPYFCTIGSVYNLRFNNDQFDTVLAMGLFEYLDSPEIALNNIIRVTKSNGNILV